MGMLRTYKRPNREHSLLGSQGYVAVMILPSVRR